MNKIAEYRNRKNRIRELYFKEAGLWGGLAKRTFRAFTKMGPTGAVMNVFMLKPELTKKFHSMRGHIKNIFSAVF